MTLGRRLAIRRQGRRHPLFAQAFNRIFAPAMERDVAPVTVSVREGLSEGAAVAARGGLAGPSAGRNRHGPLLVWSK